MMQILKHGAHTLVAAVLIPSAHAVAASNDVILTSWEPERAPSFASTIPSGFLVAVAYGLAAALGICLVLAGFGVSERIRSAHRKEPARDARAERLLLYGFVGMVIIGVLFLGVLIALP